MKSGRLAFVLFVAAAISAPALAATGAMHNSIVVLSDVSGSMRTSDPSCVRAEALRLLADLLPDGDRLTYAEFGDDVRDLSGQGAFSLTPQSRAELSALGTRCKATDAHTDIAAALEFAAQRLGSSSADDRAAFRPAVVFLTDGKDDVAAGGDRRERIVAAVESLRRIGAPVYAVGLSSNADHKLLQEISERTAGHPFFVLDPSDLLGGFFDVSRELAARWAVFDGLAAGGSVSVVIPPWAKSIVALHRTKGAGGSLYSLERRTAPAGGGSVEFGTVPGAKIAVDVAGDVRLVPRIPQVVPAGVPFACGAALIAAAQDLGHPGFLSSTSVTVRWGERSDVLYDDGTHDDGAAGDGDFGGTCLAPTPGKADVALSLAGPLVPHLTEVTTVESVADGVTLDGPSVIMRWTAVPFGGASVALHNRTDAAIRGSLDLADGSKDVVDLPARGTITRRVAVHQGRLKAAFMPVGAGAPIASVDLPVPAASSVVAVLVAFAVLLGTSLALPRRAAHGVLMATIDDSDSQISASRSIFGNGPVEIAELPAELRALGTLTARSGLWRGGVVYEAPPGALVQFLGARSARLRPNVYLLRRSASWSLTIAGRRVTCSLMIR